MNYLMRHNLKAWELHDPKYQSTYFLKLTKPQYGENFIMDAMTHIASQKKRYDCFLERGTEEDAANCLLVLCLKKNAMLTKMLGAQLQEFKNQGGFAENLTKTRLDGRREQAISEGAPACPKCGKPMLRRTIQRGVRQGQQFWGCSNYPECNATLKI